MIGIDLVKIERIKNFKERFGEKGLKKFLNNEEIDLATEISTVAGFWASKEAISKALGLGISQECSFFDIRIYKDEKNRPYFKLSKHLIERFKINGLSLSITHEGGFAIAVAYIKSAKKERREISF